MSDPSTRINIRGLTTNTLALRRPASTLPTFPSLLRAVYTAFRNTPAEYRLHLHFYPDTRCEEGALLRRDEYERGEYFIGGGVEFFAHFARRESAEGGHRAVSERAEKISVRWEEKANKDGGMAQEGFDKQVPLIQRRMGDTASLAYEILDEPEEESRLALRPVAHVPRREQTHSPVLKQELDRSPPPGFANFEDLTMDSSSEAGDEHVEVRHDGVGVSDRGGPSATRRSSTESSGLFVTDRDERRGSEGSEEVVEEVWSDERHGDVVKSEAE